MSMVIRPARASDLEQLPDVLQAGFATYTEHLEYTTEVLAALQRWPTTSVDVSQAVEIDGRLVGAFLAGVRPGEVDGEPVTVCHPWVLAVLPHLRRQGVASALLTATADAARAAGADVIGLITQEIYLSHKLYLRNGYRVVERFRQRWRADEVLDHDVPGAVEVDAATFASRRPYLPARPNALAEGPKDALFDEPLFRTRFFVAGAAGVGTCRWRVLVGPYGRRQPAWAVEILQAFGDGPDLDAALSAAARAGREDRGTGLYYSPALRREIAGFSEEGMGWVLRYAAPLSDRGAAALDRVTAWDHLQPAP
jgi:ribosomal protein S18 acetylase RimI-like enzyme